MHTSGTNKKLALTNKFSVTPPNASAYATTIPHIPHFSACFLASLFFFFQAEDGIRHRNVTGVQTCALPISNRLLPRLSLGIRHVGEGGAKLLARHFGTMDALREARQEAIGEIRGIGPAIAEAVAGDRKSVV